MCNFVLKLENLKEMDENNGLFVFVCVCVCVFLSLKWSFLYCRKYCIHILLASHVLVICCCQAFVLPNGLSWNQGLYELQCRFCFSLKPDRLSECFTLQNNPFSTPYISLLHRKRQSAVESVSILSIKSASSQTVHALRRTLTSLLTWFLQNLGATEKMGTEVRRGRGGGEGGLWRRTLSMSWVDKGEDNGCWKNWMREEEGGRSWLKKSENNFVERKICRRELAKAPSARWWII